MSIHHISRKSISQTTKVDQQLKPGQIIQGKILRLYPDNKAQIQIGSKVMVAQLEVSLQLGERYVFQVENTSDLVQLKVIGDQSKAQAETSIGNLLKNLGLKVTKANVEFTEKLINERVPFDKQQLSQALKLLDGAKDKVAAEQILKQMLTEKMPLNESVFKALYAKSTTELSGQMTSLLNELRAQSNPSQLTGQIIKQISDMIEHPLSPKNELMMQIINEAKENDQQLFNTLKAVGAIANDLNFETWKSDWEKLARQHNITPLTVSNPKLNDVSTPIVIQDNNLEETLLRMQSSKQSLQSESQAFSSKWAKLINESFIKDTPLSTQDFAQLKQEITEKLFLVLTENQRNVLTKLMENNPAQLRQLLTRIQAFSSEAFYTKNEEILAIFNQSFGSMSSSPKEQFLGNLRQMLMFSGITDENLLAQELTTKDSLSLRSWVNTINESLTQNTPLSTQDFTQLKQEITERLLPLLTDTQKNKLLKLMEQNNPVALQKLALAMQSLTDENVLKQEPTLKDSMSLKSMLIQMISHPEGVSTERAQQLLHFINGLQLQSVNETGNFIQASLQLPGEKLSLNSDLYLDFESKKTEDGKINADFCRIMFYLDLNNLKETVIDMNIQKRLISVTIYNDQQKMPEEFKMLQPMLKKGLAEHNYQLSRVSIKPLNNVDKATFHQKQMTRTPIDSKSYEGIDFQV